MSPQRFGHPHRVAREKLVIVRRTQEAHDAQLDDQLIHQLLCLHLGDHPCAQVLLDVDVEEGRCASQRHGRAILILHGSQVGEIKKLHRLAAVACRLRHVKPVGLAHLFKRLQRFNLLAHLLAAADGIFGILLNIEPLQKSLPLLYQRCGAIERHATVVADDASTSVCIGESRDDARTSCRQHLLVVCREHSLVVRLAVARKDLPGHRVQLVAIGIQRVLHHADASFREDAPFQRCIGLQPYHHLVLPVNVSGSVGINLLRILRFGVVHPFGLLFAEHLRQFVPHLARTLGRCCQKRVVPLVGGIVVHDEVSHVDLFSPCLSLEPFPCCMCTIHHNVYLSLYVSVFRCFDVSMFRRFDVSMFRCFDVSTF